MPPVQKELPNILHSENSCNDCENNHNCGNYSRQQTSHKELSYIMIQLIENTFFVLLACIILNRL